jgi:integrase
MAKKDLNYTARQEHKRAVLLQSIADINENLKYEKMGVVLAVRGESLTIRYSDPDKRRREISPKSISLSASGVDAAKRIAVQISMAIADGTYTDDWVDSHIYKKKTAVDKPIEIALTWGDIIATFETRWLISRSSDRESTDRQKKRTLVGYRAQLKLAGSVSNSATFDRALITELLSRQPEGSDKRFRLREALSVISQLFGVAYNYKGIGKRPKPARREIPSDDQIVAAYHRFDSIHKVKRNDIECIPVYQWYFGMLATYGLRPQELWGIDLAQSFKAESDYWIYLDETIADGLKTGNRWIAPLHLEWVRLFDLAVPKYKAGLYGDLQTRVNGIGKYFRLHGIGIKPYDLRHAYAIRCRILGIELLDAADLMGHDPETHYKQYHRWIGKDEQMKSVRSALSRNKLI